jgi:dinuclear metal center YbgI/SA1388 family protein
MPVARSTLDAHLNGLLAPERFKDYGPNGLQVEGRSEVRRVVTGVTASLAMIEAAIADGADALLVHHGLFWRGHDGRVTGWMKQRLQRLLAAELNLFAFHLPLDAHPVLGNNARFGAQLALQADGRFGDQDLGFIGPAGTLSDLPALLQRLEAVVQRPVVCVPGDGRPLRRIAWCTGGAQGFFEAAIAAGADAYLTGEISEPQAHYARETGVAFLACGHHATERYGVQAVGEALAQALGVEHRYIEVDNPA